MGDLGCLTSILRLAPSSRFPLIQATLFRFFRVRSSLPEEAYQRADSMKNLGAGVSGRVGVAAVPVMWAGGRAWAFQRVAVGFLPRLDTQDFTKSLSLGPQIGAQLGNDLFLNTGLGSWVLGKGSRADRLESWEKGGSLENWIPWGKSFRPQPQFPHQLH